MQQVQLTPEFFQGAISLENGDGYIQPWRLPYDRLALFLSPNNALANAAAHASGVRLRFTTDATSVRLQLNPMPSGNVHAKTRTGAAFDITINGELIDSQVTPEGAESVTFESLPAGEKTLELWLPNDATVGIRTLELNEGASWSLQPDTRPKWVTYGSSLTHCVRAYSPSRTWPAIVARKHGLNLTSLGYGGQCHLDPLVAMMIRDLPADYITLKLGINTISGTLNARTFPAAVMGLVCIIREKHPTTPITVVSPIGHPPRETEPNVVGYTISDMRAANAEVVRLLQEAGDSNLRYVDGLKVFDLASIAKYSVDQCHPNAEGIELQAENFDREVMRPLLGLS